MSAENAAPMTDLTGFQRDLLTTVRELAERTDTKRPHGLAIKDELEEYYDEEIHHGRLYPNLDTLVNKGLVVKGTRDRRTNTYDISDRGKRSLTADLSWRQP